MILLKGINFKHIIGISLWPFVLVKPNEPDGILINHERIHLRQQAEMLVIPFYIWYLLEWLIKLAYYKNWDQAYRNICFERESYINEDKLDYLKTRGFWEFLKYL